MLSKAATGLPVLEHPVLLWGTCPPGSQHTGYSHSCDVAQGRTRIHSSRAGRPGAGAAVTAAGIYADFLKIATSC